VVDTREILHGLAEPFDADEVRWKPQIVSGNRAMAIAYVSARTVMDRLDDVLGAQNWRDEYQCLPDGNVVCMLSLRLDGEWLSKSDVGGPSEQPDSGDRMKSAFSEALKRPAVKWSVGRYLYRLSSQWCDYDPHKKQFLRTPSLPRWALPVREAKATPVQAPAPRVTAEQVREVEMLLAAKRRKWAAALRWLRQQPDLPELAETAAVADMRPEHHRRLVEMLGPKAKAQAK
jgi:hypothetical protein